MGNKGIAKGKIFVSKEDLHKLLGIPEGVEIVGTRTLEAGDNGFEFLIVSGEEIEGITYRGNVGQLRRTPINKLPNTYSIEKDNNNYNIHISTTNQDEEEVIKHIQESFRNLS